MATATLDEVLDVVLLISERIENIEMRLDADGTGVVAATDDELDDKYGDPEVRTDPSDWRGASQIGHKYSECPPEFLNLLIKMLMWQYRKDREEKVETKGGKPRSKYRFRDAKLAKGWLNRIQNGWNRDVTNTTASITTSFIK